MTILPFYRLSTVGMDGIGWYQLVRLWARVCREVRRVRRDFTTGSTTEVTVASV